MILDAFEQVLSVLDESGKDEFNGAWMSLVGDRLLALEDAYRILTVAEREPIDYSELPTQAAYVFAYGMPRAGITYLRLKQHREDLGQPLFTKPSIKVASVGGGPASELGGLIAYLNDVESTENVTSIEYTVFDRSEAWEHVADLLVDALSDNIEIKLYFHEIDLLNGDEVNQTSLAGFDLVIFSYVVSELCGFESQHPVEDNIRHLFRTLDSGGFILYLDSESFPFYSFFNKCKSYVKGLRQRSDVGGNTVFEVGAYEGIFAEYCDELERKPRLDLNIVSKLLERD